LIKKVLNEFDPKQFVARLTTRPGVYRMLDADGGVLYVGKAANLKKRVGSYFGRRQDSPKTRAMVRQVCDIEVTVTATEGEALLLESNLIKEYRPRYNVFFRDDKSYPYLYLDSGHDYPRLSFYRGARSGKGRYFGPYPSAGSARRTLNLVQKLFQIRQCDDSFFRNRSRPCLQYQIKRCSAPCVGYVEPEAYAEDVERAVLFLEGRNEEVIESLLTPMQRAADNLDYERAAHYRDQIASLRRIQGSQHITAPRGESDIIACRLQGGQACVQVFYLRGGRHLGNKAFFPRHSEGETPAAIITAFLTQYYLSGGGERRIPPVIYLSHRPEDAPLLERLLPERAGTAVRLRHRPRGDAARWLEMAGENAAISLQEYLSRRQKYAERLEQLRELLGLEEPIERVECFDISHTGGEATVASCVVYGVEGALKSDYRRFNIAAVTAADDYAAMRQVIERRYTRIRKEEGRLPDLILVDGGKGQVGAVRGVLAELQLADIPLLGVAKGPSRRPGLETLILSDGGRELHLPPASPLLHLIQEIRDEAHRFAITGHRQRRQKKRGVSLLESIEGIGSKRRQQLIRHFGGLQGVERAGVEDLAKVSGINKNLAQKIYDTFHDQ
jgi:excinuclease ABC subunit C